MSKKLQVSGTLRGSGIAPSNAPVTYVGAWNSSQGTAVADLASNNVGDRRCNSGAASGEICGAIVTQTNAFCWRAFSVDMVAALNGINAGLVVHG
jgi:hypothetical protein